MFAPRFNPLTHGYRGEDPPDDEDDDDDDDWPDPPRDWKKHVAGMTVLALFSAAATEVGQWAIEELRRAVGRPKDGNGHKDEKK